MKTVCMHTRAIYKIHPQKEPYISYVSANEDYIHLRRKMKTKCIHTRAVHEIHAQKSHIYPMYPQKCPIFPTYPQKNPIYPVNLQKSPTHPMYLQMRTIISIRMYIYKYIYMYMCIYDNSRELTVRTHVLYIQKISAKEPYMTDLSANEDCIPAKVTENWQNAHTCYTYQTYSQKSPLYPMSPQMRPTFIRKKNWELSVHIHVP